MNLYAIFLVSVSSLFYIYEFFLRVMPSVITQELMQEFEVNAGFMSLMTSCFLYAYACMQIPAGLLVDRYGPRLVLTAAVTVCAIATYLFQSTHDITVACMARLMLGAASSVAFIAPLTLASRWFAPKYLALVAGCVQLLGCLGAVLGGTPIVILNHYIGWRNVMIYAAYMGIFLALLFWFLIKDAPETHRIKEKKASLPIISQLLHIITHKQSLWIALTAFSSWSAMGSLAELWGVPFLVKFHNLDAHHAALMVMIIWLGVAVGSPLAGWWTEYTSKHILPLRFLLFLSLITTLVLIYFKTHSTILYINLFLMGFSAGAQPITFSLIALHNPPERIATAFGFNNMAVVCGASFLQPMIGGLLDLFWQGTSDGSRIYSIATYQYALTVVPIAILIGIIACFFIDDQKSHT